MGSPADEPVRGNPEGPQHWVEVGAFALGRYAVTFDDWDACVADGGCTHQPDDRGWGRSRRPVINVSWDDAQQYVRWLSRVTGKTYRLPSEAEWEYATRAGTITPFSTGNCISSSQANYNCKFDYNDCGAKTGLYTEKSQPVGSYPANPWGLYDMHGNVWEWAEDSWNQSYTGAPTDGKAWRDGDTRERVLRGGSWFSYPWLVRSACRDRFGTSERRSYLGFRVALTLTP